MNIFLYALHFLFLNKMFLATNYCPSFALVGILNTILFVFCRKQQTVITGIIEIGKTFAIISKDYNSESIFALALSRIAAGFAPWMSRPSALMQLISFIPKKDFAKAAA